MSLTAVASRPIEAAGEDARAALPIDLDASASAAPTPAVVAAVVRAMSALHGNPSSAHLRGAASRTLLADAREAVAGLVDGASPEAVVLTSGCTEANNMVLAGFARARARIVSTEVEHPSILSCLERVRADGGDVVLLPVDAGGRVRLDRLRDELGRGGATLLSVQAANSETGVRQDLAAIAALVAERDDVVLHSDAAQAIGRVDLAMGRGKGPDLLTMSGHKLHAPMGVGALLAAEDCDAELHPLVLGGAQEGGLRAGTQAVPAVAGLGAACTEWAADPTGRRARLAALRARLEELLAAFPDATVNGAGSPRLPHVASVTFRGCDGMALAAGLDAAGVAASQGSACSSMRPTPSHVLRAMGLGEADAFSTIRFSVSILNEVDEIERAVAVVAAVVGRLRSRA